MFPLPDTYNPTGTFFSTYCNHPSVCPSGSQSWRLNEPLHSHFTHVEHVAWWAQVQRFTGAHQLWVQIEETAFLFMKLYPESDSLANLFPQFEAEFWQKKILESITLFFFFLWFSKSENYLGGILNDFKVKKWETSLISCNQLCHVQLQQALEVCVSCFSPLFHLFCSGVFPSPGTRTFVMQNLGYGCREAGPETEGRRKD